VDEERNGFLPGRNITVNARRLLIPPLGIVFCAEFGLARQVAVVFFQIVVVFVQRSGFSRVRFAPRWRAGTSFATRTTVSRAAASSTATSTARPLGLFGAGLGCSFRFFQDRVVGLFQVIADHAILGTLFVAEDLGFWFFRRSFVAHWRLPIHRSCRSLSPRARTSPSTAPAGWTSTFIGGFLGLSRGCFRAILELVNLFPKFRSRAATFGALPVAAVIETVLAGVAWLITAR
jgi:hypothetical protein